MLINNIVAHPVWHLAFRPWFLLASLSAVISMALWALSLNGWAIGVGNLGLSLLVWHGHEMVFGFACTIALGFLLTAVQTWTGERSLHGGLLFFLTLVWLSARVLLWRGDALLQWLGFGFQMLWWGMCILSLARVLIVAKNKRNYLFIPMTSVLMALNFGVLYAALSKADHIALELLRGAIILFGVLISVIAGRVIPFFTRRGVATASVTETPLLDRCLPLVSSLLFIVFVARILSTVSLLDTAFSVLCIVTGALHGYRLLHWNSWETRNTPLVWTLHVSYLFLSLGFVVLGLSTFIDRINFSTALHLITVGAIGGMILPMIVRVSLGHTGRALKASPLMSAAFIGVFLAALLRFVCMWLGLPFIAWNISAFLWVLAFACFIIVFADVLLKPRADGK
ncbi:MAG: NnrS family protein [Agarilytica sp.]